jgi:hypothetical protein
MEAKMEGRFEKVKENQKKMKAVLEEMKAALVACQEEMKFRMNVFEEILDKTDVKAGQGKTETMVETGQEQTRTEGRTDLEEMKATESEAIAEQQEVPNEEAAVEIVPALEDRSGDHQPAVRYRNPLKRRTQGDVIRGIHKEPTSERRRLTGPERNNGVKNRDMKEQLCLGSKRTLGETFRHTIELEIAGRIVGPSIGLRKVSDRTL